MKLKPTSSQGLGSNNQQDSNVASPYSCDCKPRNLLGGNQCNGSCNGCATVARENDGHEQMRKTLLTEIPPEEPRENPFEFLLKNPNNIEDISEETLASVLVSGEGKYFPPELKRKLQAYMKSLTDRQVQVLQLLFWKQVSISETAKLLGMSRQGVIGHRRRALRKLKALIQKRILEKKEGKVLQKYLREIFSGA